MNNTIPTAREFYDKHDSDDCVVMMIDFAKLHVDAALNAAAYNAEMKLIPYTEDEYEINRRTISTAYPLENIK